jgi:hypothetical protein
MSETPTPGQVAYEGYMRVYFGTWQEVVRGYANLEPLEREAWDAAAQAVLTHHTQQETTP